VSLTRVGIAGLGLIGGSIGLGLRRAGHPVAGCEPDPDARALAVRRGAVERWLPDVAALGQVVDVLFLAAPPQANLDLLRQLAASGPPGGLLVSDTGSVKADIQRLGQELFPGPVGPRFVAGHPMAGAESAGPGAARASLFEDAPWYLCGPGAPPGPLLELLRDLGARARECEASEHDRMVAALSHVPQVLAWLLRRDWHAAGWSEADGGPAAREFARLARSSPQLWADVLLANRGEVAAALRRLAGGAGELAGALEDADARRARRRIEELTS
jgi:prephenate dehydrogenase